MWGGGGGGGGGGQKTKWKTPSSNFVELIESITNMLLSLLKMNLKKKIIPYLIYLNMHYSSHYRNTMME